MMLWTRAWKETRVRLLLGAAMLAFVCAVIVLFGDAPRHHGGGIPWTSFIWNAVYKDYVRNVYIVLVIVLGGGTLLQERAQGTTAFTLSLPVSRRRLLLARVGVGLLEVCALAGVPAVIIPALSTVVRQQYPAAEAWRFAALWAVGGTLMFGLAVLWASVLANEYVAWAVAFLSLMLVEATINYSGLAQHRSFDVLRLMNGTGWGTFDPKLGLLAGAPPWGGAAGALAASLGLLVATERVTSRRDFA